MNVRTLILLLLFGVASVISILPLFHSGFFPMHDNTQVARVFEMKKALSDGFFPVRLVQDLGYGYGYPIFNFYAPLSYYFGGIIALFGVASLTATKVMIAIAMILSGVSMYLLARLFVRSEGATIAGILYLYAPYHAVNLYIRGAVAELFAYAFLPLVFYGLIHLWRKGDSTSVVFAGVSLAAVILSHNLSALMLIPFYGFLVLYFLLMSKTNTMRYFIVLAGLLGLLLSAFYWLPALLETKYTSIATLITGGSFYKDHFVCLLQLWRSPWGFGGSAPGCLDGLSFQVGKIHILLTLLAIVAIYFTKAKKVLAFSLLGALASVFMLLPYSLPIWSILSPLAYLQFPWRYLQFVSFFLSLAGGIGVYSLTQHFFKNKRFGGIQFVSHIFIVCVIVTFYMKDFKPQRYEINYPDQTKTRELNWTVSKVSDEYLPSSLIRPEFDKQVPKQPIESGGIVRIISNKTQELEATITQSNSLNVTINKGYFPAWTIRLNNQDIVPPVKDGLYRLSLPAGTNTLSVRFESTPVERIANLLSIIGLVALIGIIILRRKITAHAKTS